MINTPSKDNGKSLDIYSTFTYGDARIELEIMVPKGSNSGITCMANMRFRCWTVSGGPSSAWATWALSTGPNRPP